VSAHHFAPHAQPDFAAPFAQAQSAGAPQIETQTAAHTSQRPVSVLGWALAFGAGAAMWVAIFALLT
jgi:hypothetical protein